MTDYANELTPEREAERTEVLDKARAAKQVAATFAQLTTPRKNEILAVSYTHLTLPTIYSV